MATAPNFVTVSRRPPDVEDYIDMLRRYRSWLIGPMFAGLVIAVVVAFLWPGIYLGALVLLFAAYAFLDGTNCNWSIGRNSRG